MSGILGYSVNPSSGAFGEFWPSSGAVPQSYSTGGWTIGSEGFTQQSFLGASIRDFSVQGAFGDSSSILDVNLVEDEYNKSDGLGSGIGDDVYHNGMRDEFNPPPVGSPVFFKFGKHFATTEQAWRKTLDDIYGYDTFDDIPELPFRETDPGSGLRTLAPNEFVDLEKSESGVYHVVDKTAISYDNHNAVGSGHFVFGGILQRYRSETSDQGKNLYSLAVVDPREILSNTTLILNNYANSVLQCPNLINVFGFLEYNPTDDLRQRMNTNYSESGILTKYVYPNGDVQYSGGFDPVTFEPRPQYTDCYTRDDWLNVVFGRTGLGATRDSIIDRLFGTDPSDPNGEPFLPNEFPFTGTSFGRRSEKGLPFYRIIQGINALMEFGGLLPTEYKLKNFGGKINFRGFNYVVDFTGLPVEKIPALYSFDFDQMTLMEFCQEFCDIISHDLYVSLLPVIDHPGCQYYHKLNEYYIDQEQYGEIITGIIRIDAIPRDTRPSYGAIDQFIKNLEDDGVNIQSKEVGYELSNISTDKFVVGAQEVEMYYFTGNADRDFLEVRKSQNGLSNRYQQEMIEQWHLSNSLKQQVLPFYGFLGEDAVTIPRGYGSFQQIMLDATSLNANGVGNYYIATEVELRAASVSFEAWKDFLLQYNDLYLESLEEDDTITGHILQTLSPDNDKFAPAIPSDISNNYGVTVPRSVFRSDRNYMGDDGLPASPCSPPFGYPLYFKRALKIGLPEAGLTNFAASKNRIITNLAKLKSSDDKNWKQLVSKTLKDLLDENRPGISPEERQFITDIKETLKNAANPDQAIGIIEEKFLKNDTVYHNLPRLAEENTKNALEVYNFVKRIADENLGKKFLVKIPRETNPFYSKFIGLRGIVPPGAPPVAIDIAASERVNEIQYGPFGFTPRKISDNIGIQYDSQFNSELYQMRSYINTLNENANKSYLDFSLENGISSLVSTYLDTASFVFDRRYGALQGAFNGIDERHEFNYQPEPQGGFFEFDLYGNLLNRDHLDLIPDTSDLPPGTQQALIPRDMTNFVNDSNRISSYVRFDNSQFLNFKDFPEDSIAQQIITHEGYIIPDVTNQLENMDEDRLSDFPNDEYKAQALSSKPNSVCFIKCDLEDRFFMPPKVEFNILTDVFARQVEDIGKVTPPRRIWDEDSSKWIDSYPIYKAHYIPAYGSGIPESGGGLDGTRVFQQDFVRYWDHLMSGEIVSTHKQNQDFNHVYALVTLPAKVVPTIDSRMQDGPFQSFEGAAIKHFLTMDTVKGVEGFEKPAVKNKPSDFLCENIEWTNDAGEYLITNDAIANAFNAHRAAIRSLSANSLAVLNYTQPSPVYPDLVAIPLLSRDRCYGPWLSSNVISDSQIYQSIPGKIDFIKNENLAPWNYAGYQLLNEAGQLEAQFSNSLQLFTENGSITYEGLPSGNNLCQALIDGGPLVTNINVNVGTGGVTTSYSMNVYTPRFGKIQKQREDMIALISRQRQQIVDERNALIRKGMGKAQKAVNYAVMNNQLNSIKGAARLIDTWTERVETGEDLSVKKVSAIEKKREQVVATDGTTTVRTDKDISTQSNPTQAVDRAKNKMPTDADRKNADNNSAEEIVSPPASKGPHPTLPRTRRTRTHYTGK